MFAEKIFNSCQQQSFDVLHIKNVPTATAAENISQSEYAPI